MNTDLKITRPAYLFPRWKTFLVGAIYGLLLRLAFVSSWIDSLATVMISAFVIGMPLAAGALTIHLAERIERRDIVFYLTAPWGTVFMIAVGCAVTAIEGSICIFIALPLFLFISSLGGLTYGLLGRRFIFPKHTIQGVLALPFALLLLEPYLPVPQQFTSVTREIDIAAPAPLIWAEIMNPKNIQAKEFSTGIAYMIGVPTPLEASLNHEAVGGLRSVKWARGVHFTEEVTAIEPQRSVAWKYHFSEDSFPPGSMDDHVRVGGEYFDLGETSYTLTPQANGTKLRIQIQYRVSTSFNWYTQPLADYLLQDTADTLLKFYKHRTEYSAPKSRI